MTGDLSFLWDDAPPSSEIDPGTSTRVYAQPGLPAEPGLWVFVLDDMTIFGLFFTVFSWEGSQARELFTASTQSLIQPIGVANTLVLLLSSYFVVLALHAHRTGRFETATRMISGALGCAIAFALLKAVEYHEGITGGHVPGTNVFFTFYYVMTGVHLLHVFIGAALLLVWRSRVKRAEPFLDGRRLVEASAVYWHMVDLLWILIFTIVYLAAAS
jgi:nitric oxide reductase NorE protein